MSTDILAINDQEAEVYESYRNMYMAQNAYPTLKSAYRWRDAGIIFVGKMITTLSAILLAGFRTAEQFYLAASNQGNSFLGWAEAILAVLAIEGLILFLAADRAKQRGKVHHWTSTAGIFLAVLISLLAGMGQSIRLIEGLDIQIFGWFTTALAIGLAFASLVAYIGGEIVGQELARIDVVNKKNYEVYEKEVDVWETRFQANWSHSDHRKMVRASLHLVAQLGTKDGTNQSVWKSLSHDDKLKVAQLTASVIEKKYSLPRRTAYNWLEQAKKYAEEYVYHGEQK